MFHQISVSGVLMKPARRRQSMQNLKETTTIRRKCFRGIQKPARTISAERNARDDGISKWGKQKSWLAGRICAGMLRIAARDAVQG
jgi:hypothetical protein